MNEAREVEELQKKLNKMKKKDIVSWISELLTKEKDIRIKVAADENTPCVVFVWLFEGKKRGENDVLMNLVENKSVPQDVQNKALWKLLNRKDKHIRKFVAEHADDGEMIKMLVKRDRRIDVLTAVLKNPNTPSELKREVKREIENRRRK